MNLYDSNMNALKALRSGNAAGDANAAAIEKLKASLASPSVDPGFYQPDIPVPKTAKISPDTSVQLGTEAPALSFMWDQSGVMPPDAGNPESYMGRVLNRIRLLGPDWKSQLKEG